MNNVRIRKAIPEDMDAVKYICRMTAGPTSIADERAGEVTALTYASYYIREECDTCFVLEDTDENKVVGYTLCAPNYKKFCKIYRKVDVPKIREYEKKAADFAKLIPFPYMFFGFQYPAHLHIDLMEGYRGGGNGSKLIGALSEELKSRNVKGVMLCVDSDNEGAIRFYRKNGFRIVAKGPGFKIMGQKL